MSDDQPTASKTSFKIKLPRNKFLDISANKNVLETLATPSLDGHASEASDDESGCGGSDDGTRKDCLLSAETHTETVPCSIKNESSDENLVQKTTAVNAPEHSATAPSTLPTKRAPRKNSSPDPLHASESIMSEKRKASNSHPIAEEETKSDRKIKKIKTPSPTLASTLEPLAPQSTPPSLSLSPSSLPHHPLSQSTLSMALRGPNKATSNLPLFLGSQSYSPDALLPDHRQSVGAFLDVYIANVHLSLANPKVAYRCLWGGSGSPPSYTDDSDLVAVLAHLGLVTLTERPATHDLCARICIGSGLKEHIPATQGASGSFSRNWPCDHDGASFSVVKVFTLAIGKAKARAKSQAKTRRIFSYALGKQSLSTIARPYYASLELERPSELPSDVVILSNSMGEPCKKYSLYSFWLSLLHDQALADSSNASLMDDLSLLERKLNRADLILESKSGLTFKLAKEAASKETYIVTCVSPRSSTQLWSGIVMHDIKWSNQTLKIKNDSIGLIKLYYWRNKESC